MLGEGPQAAGGWSPGEGISPRLSSEPRMLPKGPWAGQGSRAAPGERVRLGSQVGSSAGTWEGGEHWSVRTRPCLGSGNQVEDQDSRSASGEELRVALVRSSVDSCVGGTHVPRVRFPVRWPVRMAQPLPSGQPSGGSAGNEVGRTNHRPQGRGGDGGVSGLPLMPLDSSLLLSSASLPERRTQRASAGSVTLSCVLGDAVLCPRHTRGTTQGGWS